MDWTVALAFTSDSSFAYPGMYVDDITVLVSDSDQLLLLSQAVNLGERLGQSDDVDVDGVAIIDVTGLDNAGLGNHVYHLTNEAVGKAIGAILDGKAPPDL